MGLISSYPNASTPLSPTDKIIGTDANSSDATKNFTIAELTSYLQSQLMSSVNRGSFYDVTDQSAAVINTAYPMKFGTVDTAVTNGISVETDSLGNKTLITLPALGVYNIQFSAQLKRSTGGSSETVDIWLKDFTGNANVANTNTSLNVQANANYLVAAWNFFFECTSVNQQVQLMWATTSTAVTIEYDPASAPHPATPSTILTVNQIA